MALTQSDKEFIQLVIHGVNGRIDSVQTLLEAKINETIELQKKTNGNVRKHDEQISEALIERAQNRQEQKDNFHKLDEVIKKVDELKEIEKGHITTCPQAPKVRELEDAFLTQKTKDESKSLIFGRTAQIIIILIMFGGLITSIGLGLANLNKKSGIQFAPMDANSSFRGFPLDSVYHNDSLNPAPKYEFK